MKRDEDEGEKEKKASCARHLQQVTVLHFKAIYSNVDFGWWVCFVFGGCFGALFGFSLLFLGVILFYFFSLGGCSVVGGFLLFFVGGVFVFFSLFLTHTKRVPLILLHCILMKG